MNFFNRLPTFLSSLALASSFIFACGQSEDSVGNCEGEKCDITKELQLCAAIRGNGQLISAHFASLARIVEEFGTIDGAAGGSSASITMLLLESMQMNTLTKECDGRKCSEDETSARVALLIKSFPGYLVHLSTTEEAAAIGDLLPLVMQFQSQVASEGIESLLQSADQVEIQAGLDALQVLLESEDLVSLINPELVPFIQGDAGKSQAARKFHAEEVLEGVKNLGSFAADSDRIFFRPGILNFDGLAEKMGRVGSFYAGLGPSDEIAMESFLSSCAAPGMGKTWFEVAQMSAGDSSCGLIFDQMVKKYRMEWMPGVHHNRIDDAVGASMRTLVSTSVLVGDTAEDFGVADALYRDAKDYDFRPNFDDIKFGYWGQQKDLQAMAKNAESFSDLKSEKFLSLGETSWRNALRYSPAEPGLSAALPLSESQVSAGGWSDLHPVLGLRNMGCDEIIYVTRRGEESGFAQGVAELLGMAKSDKDALYNLDERGSSFTKSLSEADAVWCTDWDAFDATDLVSIGNDGFHAPLESTSAFFTRSQSPYPNLKASVDMRGCTPSFQETTE